MKFKNTRYNDLTNEIFKTNLDVSYKKLTSLEGRPEVVNGIFNCSCNKLVSLEFGPKIVTKDYCCNNNDLTSLKGSPEEIGGAFQCYSNDLISLEGSPKLINGHFNCENNKLTNIKEQIIKYGIKAKSYWTDEGSFTFKDIEEEFDKYRDYLLKKEKRLQEKQNIKNNKLKINNQDYGFGI